MTLNNECEVKEKEKSRQKGRYVIYLQDIKTFYIFDKIINLNISIFPTAYF